MNFLNPLGLILTLILPIIAILHFKKQQVVERKISYIGLWDEVIKEIQGIRHNRINQYLLLLLQLLIGLLIIMALAGPVLVKPFEGDNITIALDCSMTMQAKENDTTRFEMAKEAIKEYLKEIDDDVLISLIALKGSSERIAKDAEKSDVIGILENLECTYETLNIKKADEIINLDSEKCRIFSDKHLNLEYKHIKVGSEFMNIGIIYGSYDYYSNTALFRVKNYEKARKTIVVSLEDEQGRKDIQRLDIEGNTTVDVSWPKVWENSQILSMSVLEDDMLKEDNKFLLPIGNRFKAKVLMLGENYFLRNALLSIPCINVDFKSEYKVQKNEYDLYILNTKPLESQLPKEANIWYLNPTTKMIDGSIDTYSKIKVLDDNFSADINSHNLYIENSFTLKNDGDMNTVLKVEEKPVMSYRIEKDTKKIYSTIDWNKTNMPLQPDFPVLIENIVKWFLNDKKNWYEPGDYIYIGGDNFKLIAPSGIKIDTLSKPVTLNEIGIYKLIKKDKGMKNFVVNPSKKIIENHEYEDDNAILFEDYPQSRTTTILDLKNILIVILLILLVVEWEVYRRSV